MSSARDVEEWALNAADAGTANPMASLMALERDGRGWIFEFDGNYGLAGDEIATVHYVRRAEVDEVVRLALYELGFDLDREYRDDDGDIRMATYSRTSSGDSP